MATVVDVRGLRVEFGPVLAVDDVDLTVPGGRSAALVGRNGAGKSTTLRVLGGVLPATNGSIRVCGVSAVADPIRVRELVGYCPDVGGLIPRATPWEHLQLAARLRRLPRGWEQRAEELLERFDLRQHTDRVVAGFSHGMGRRMSVLLAAFHSPPVLLLDEPFDGVDPLGVDATFDVIDEARTRGAAVILSTHLLPLAARASDDVIVLSRGRIAGSAPSGDMSGDAGAERYRSLIA